MCLLFANFFFIYRPPEKIKNFKRAGRNYYKLVRIFTHAVLNGVKLL